MVSGGTVADVGTDHAYLPLYLVASGKCVSAVASDIAEGPLARAAETIRGYEDRIRLVRSDGLKAIDETEVDCIVVAGMGGDLIRHIIESSGWSFEGKTLILQPMTKQHELRRWLWEAGFDVTEERLSEDAGTLYRAFKAVRGHSSEPEPWELRAGKPLFERNDPLLARWLDKCISTLTRARDGMLEGGLTPDEEMLEALDGLIRKREELKR